MQHQVSNRDCKGEGLPSQDNTKSHARIVDKSLLDRLKEGKAPLDKISVQVLGLNARGYNALKNAKVNTIQQLIDRGCPFLSVAFVIHLMSFPFPLSTPADTGAIPPAHIPVCTFTSFGDAGFDTTITTFGNSYRE
jgi:hypothetical protein